MDRRAPFAQWLRNGQNTTWQAIWTFAASIRKPTHLILVGVQPHRWNTIMARPKKLENMSAAELAAIEARIARIKIQKQNAARAAVREKMMAIAKEHGFDIRDLIDGRKSKRGKVAVKYRDRAGNTWTGRGRMPRWLVAATKGGKAKKEDFLVA